MPRPLCSDCSYPLSTCVCEFVTPCSHNIKLIVLQDPKENQHPKNTVRLMQLCSNNIEVIIGETPSDFSSLISQIETAPKCFALLYPSKSAVTLPKIDETANNIHTLILIDGTWRKAKKLYLKNPWLNQIVHFKLEDLCGDYTIRKTSVEAGMSTLEAAAESLRILDGANTEPMLKLQRGLAEKFTQQMPENVKRRYRK